MKTDELHRMAIVLLDNLTGEYDEVDEAMKNAASLLVLASVEIEKLNSDNYVLRKNLQVIREKNETL